MSHYRFRDGLIVESRMYPFHVIQPIAWFAELEAKSASAAGRGASG
jgi:hypothetical protein